MNAGITAFKSAVEPQSISLSTSFKIFEAKFKFDEAKPAQEIATPEVKIVPVKIGRATRRHSHKNTVARRIRNDGTPAARIVTRGMVAPLVIPSPGLALPPSLKFDDEVLTPPEIAPLVELLPDAEVLPLVKVTPAQDLEPMAEAAPYIESDNEHVIEPTPRIVQELPVIEATPRIVAQDPLELHVAPLAVEAPIAAPAPTIEAAPVERIATTDADWGLSESPSVAEVKSEPLEAEPLVEVSILPSAENPPAIVDVAPVAEATAIVDTQALDQIPSLDVPAAAPLVMGPIIAQEDHELLLQKSREASVAEYRVADLEESIEYAPDMITMAEVTNNDAEAEADEFEFDRGALVAVLDESLEKNLVGPGQKEEANPAAEKTAIQSPADTQTEALAHQSAVEKEVKINNSPLVKWNETPEDQKAGYSDMLDMLIERNVKARELTNAETDEQTAPETPTTSKADLEAPVKKPDSKKKKKRTALAVEFPAVRKGDVQSVDSPHPHIDTRDRDQSRDAYSDSGMMSIQTLTETYNQYVGKVAEPAVNTRTKITNEVPLSKTDEAKTTAGALSVSNSGHIIIQPNAAGIQPAAPSAPTFTPVNDQKKDAGGATAPSAPQTPSGPTGPTETGGREVQQQSSNGQGGVYGLNAHTDTTVVQPVPTAPGYVFSGRVVEAFTGGQRPVTGAAVQILGTPITAMADLSGHFHFDNINVSGVLPVVVTNVGYYKRRIELRSKAPVDVELVSENSVALSGVAAGEGKTVGTSFVFGQLTSPAQEGVGAMVIQVKGATPVAPVYLDENGLPKRELAMTSSRGQFMLLNLRPGTYTLEIADALGRERAPHVIHVGEEEGLVRKFSMGESRFIHGRVLNATAASAAVDGARVELMGTKKFVDTARDGRFTLGPVYVDCGDLNYIQVNKQGFYRNRIDYSCEGGDAERSIYTFSESYVNGLASEASLALNRAHGAVVGHVGFGESVKMQLWGPEEMNSSGSARGGDFYIDRDGVLNGARNRTTENGNFVIFDAPEGLSYIQAFSKDGRTLSFWPIFTSPSTVNVYAQ